jgi:hypothetical protein
MIRLRGLSVPANIPMKMRPSATVIRRVLRRRVLRNSVAGRAHSEGAEGAGAEGSIVGVEVCDMCDTSK